MAKLTLISPLDISPYNLSYLGLIRDTVNSI